MVFKEIKTKRVYEKNGEEKIAWLTVGTIRETDDGKQFIELNFAPETTFFVFEKKEWDKKKEEKPVRATQPADPSDISWEE